MVNIILIEDENLIIFKSEGHFDNKELCGVLTLAIKGSYAVIAQTPDNIVQELYSDNKVGLIEFVVRKNDEAILCFNILLAMISYIKEIYKNKIDISMKII